MYQSFRAKNFRCFEDLTVEPLSRINLITGKNNVGKTALLEALWLHHGYHNPELGLRLRTFRGFDSFKRSEFLWDLFSKFEVQKIIELSSQNQHNQAHTLNITIHEHAIAHVSLRNEQGTLTKNRLAQETTASVETEVRLRYTGGIEAHAYVEPHGVRFEQAVGIKAPPAVFFAARQRDNLETLAERFGNLAVDKKEAQVVKIMQIIEPRLKTLTVQHRSGSPVIYGDIGAKRLMPLPLMGAGMGRLLSIVLATSTVQGGILLIDEIENGLHYTIMRNIWQALGELAALYNVQFFTTTHSEECIRAAYQAFAHNKPSNFMLHRLEQVQDIVQAIAYDPGMLEAAFEIEAEMR